MPKRLIGGGAALIMVAVVSGFAAGWLVMLQQMEFGLGVVVLIGATILRWVLVSSAKALLADYIWYLPSWLAWPPDFVGGTPRLATPVGGLGIEALAPIRGRQCE